AGRGAAWPAPLFDAYPYRRDEIATPSRCKAVKKQVKIANRPCISRPKPHIDRMWRILRRHVRRFWLAGHVRGRIRAPLGRFVARFGLMRVKSNFCYR
ncbi:hypothetical protein, partial [Pseudoduganella dura]|uniref:hypothetical protein n=1 Tax=Pseudoduganella dura TaxID=321982 RepID=UPI001E350401